MAIERLAWMLTLGATALSSPVLAQEARSLDFGLQARVEHDSNVAQSSELVAQQRGLSRSDTIFTPSLNVNALIPVGRQSVFLRGAVGYTFYDKNSQLDRARVNLTGGANGRAGPCTGAVTGGLLIGQSELTDIALVTSVENVQETKRIALDLSCARPTGLGVVFSASQDWTDNSVEQLFSSESERRSIMAGFSYSRPALGSITVFANHQETEYPNRLLAVGVTDGYEMDAYGVTYSRQLGARIQGTVTAAYTTVNPASSALLGAAVADFTGTTYSGNLTFRATSRLRAQANFSRAITPSVGVGKQYDVQTGYGISADYDIGSRFAVNLGMGQNESESEGVLPSSLTLTSSRLTTVFGSVRYKQSDRISLTLNARREERKANLPQFEYSSNRIGISADVAF